jgi:hypothetical protein
MDSQTWREAGPDLYAAYREAQEVNDIVDKIECITQENHPNSGAPVVSVYYEPGSQCWTATVYTADGERLGSATRLTEIKACRALLQMLEADQGMYSPAKG